MNGVGDPGWSNNANGWDTSAYSHGTPVDQRAAVGAIAQWNGGSLGHVAYVEVVTPSYIEITDDNFGTNVTDRWRIATSSPAWPDNFIHFKDLNRYEMAFQANTGSLWSVGADPHGDWHQGMKAGTSPSIAGLSGGGYEMAFQANTGVLITVGSAGNRNWGAGMKAGTSPAITKY